MNDAERLDSRTVYRGSFLELRSDRVRLPNGRETELEIVRHPGASAVVALDAGGRVLLVRQYRYATEGWVLEVPAGKLSPGEGPEACARRELEEETGYRAGRFESLGWIWTTPGFTDEKIWLFLATDLERGRQELQSDEVLSLEALPFERAVTEALGGAIRDSKSVCALLRAERHLAGEREAGPGRSARVES